MLSLQVGVMCILSVAMFPSVACTNYEKCKWANENCENNEDCCSGHCNLAHEGTEPRCANSPLKYPCFASYQCEDGLDCGHTYSCCSPYWGVCKNTSDCCDPALRCREEDGFTYRRCLPGSSDICVISRPLLIIVHAFWIYYILMQRTRN